MKARYYAANDGKSLLKVLITLGKPEIEIHLANNELYWHEIRLDKEQADELVKFLTESPRQ